MKKQTIVELDLDVAGWLTGKPRIMREIEIGIYRLFLEHRDTTDQWRSTGCFHVELSLPEVERSKDYCPKCGGKVVGTAHGEYCPDVHCKWGWEIDTVPVPTPSVHPVGPECTESCLHGFGCTAEEQQAELNKSVLNAVKSQGYYCCTAPFGVHEVTCKNYTEKL